MTELFKISEKSLKIRPDFYTYFIGLSDLAKYDENYFLYVLLKSRGVETNDAGPLAIMNSVSLSITSFEQCMDFGTWIFPSLLTMFRGYRTVTVINDYIMGTIETKKELLQELLKIYIGPILGVIDTYEAKDKELIFKSMVLGLYGAAMIYIPVSILDALYAMYFKKPIPEPTINDLKIMQRQSELIILQKDVLSRIVDIHLTKVLSIVNDAHVYNDKEMLIQRICVDKQKLKKVLKLAPPEELEKVKRIRILMKLVPKVDVADLKDTSEENKPSIIKAFNIEGTVAFVALAIELFAKTDSQHAILDSRQRVIAR